MLTVSVPLPEGEQITLNTHTPSPPEKRSAEKANAFAGKFDRALSEKTTAGETKSAENLKKTGKKMKAGKKAPKIGDKSVAADLTRKPGRNVKGKGIARFTHIGLKTGAIADLSARKGERTAAGESDSSMQPLSLGSGRGESEAAGVENNPAILDPRKMDTPAVDARAVEAADEKAPTPLEGAASVAIAAPRARDHAETTGETPPGGESAKGKIGLENVSTAGKDTKTVIEVRDFRTREAGAASKGAVPSVTVSVEAGDEGAPEIERDITGPQIRLVRASFGNGVGNDTAAARAARSDGFQAYVRENLSGQIVKQSGIILRNNNSGEIRLVLKPEHLGRVRLRIQLDENRLSGRIFVDSSFVKESFEQNLEALYRAFRNSGFEPSGFEVFVDGRGAHEGTPKDSRPLAAKTLKQLDDGVPILEEIGQQSELINLVI